MVGTDDSSQRLGLIPCAISWLYSVIERRKEKTWMEQTVSVSAVELCCGQEETLKDLLAEAAPPTGNIHDKPAGWLDLHEDPVYGIQLRNLRVVKAPTAERAASLLDAAIASRCRGSQSSGTGIMTSAHSSHMFFSLHVHHPRTDSGPSKGPSRLTMIDLSNSVRGTSEKSDSRNKLLYAEEGPIILALLGRNKSIPNRGSKLAMLLRQSLGSLNCHTTVVAQVSHLPTHLLQTLSIVQMASNIRRAQRRTKQSTSCSPCGRSLSRERRGYPSMSLRAFHSSSEVDVDLPRLRVRGDLDDRSSSDQSCDTVIHIDSDGWVRPVGSPTKAPLSQIESIPIVPSLHPGKGDTDDPEFTALLRELLSIPRSHEAERKKEESVFWKVAEPPAPQTAETGQVERDCLKCDTFAELQERLGCIDGSETGTDVPGFPAKAPSANAVTIAPAPQTDAGKQMVAESSEVPRKTSLMMNREFNCGQISVSEKQTDGAVPEDSFQREDSGLYDCEEGSAASSSEDPPSQNSNLNTISGHTKPYDLPHDGHPKLPNELTSQSCAADAHVIPGSSPLKPNVRALLAGKSSLFSSTSASSPPLAGGVLLGDILPQIPVEEKKEMKATITVTVQQPLDLTGQDELVFTMVEEVTIHGALERAGSAGKIIHIWETGQSPPQAQGSAGSQPIRIISNVGEDSGGAGCSDVGVNPSTEGASQKPRFRVEKSLLPSFINPMLIDTHRDCDMEGPRESSNESLTRAEILPDSRQKNIKCKDEEKAPEKGRETYAIERDYHKKSTSRQLSPLGEITSDTTASEEAAFQNNKACERTHNGSDRSRPREREAVYPANPTKGFPGAGIGREFTRNSPGNSGASPGCLATHALIRTASLPRGWQNASHQQSCWDGHMTENRRDPRGVTSSTPCSPGVTLERRQGRHHSPAKNSASSWMRESPPFSPHRKHSLESRLGAGSPHRKVSDSFVDSSVNMKHDSLRASQRSPTEESRKLFSAKLEQLASRTYSQGKTPTEFGLLKREGSSTSVSSKSSSHGSYEGNSRGKYEGHKGSHEWDSKGNSKGCYQGDPHSPRASRSPKRTPRSASVSDHGHHSPISSNNHAPQSPRSTRSKLSAVGKLKIASPKVRRLSAPSTKNLSFSPKATHQSSYRSASPSPDSKTPSPEQMPPFHSSSPPQTSYFLSHSHIQSQSQSSGQSSANPPIQGTISGRIADLLFLKGRETGSTSAGLDKVPVRCPVVEDRLSTHPSSAVQQPIPSPYSRVTAPRTPIHESGHASDTTSVLSGELPPAMGKTSLLCPNRNSMVSSGYESMVRDSEATGSSTSNRDSVSDKSCAQLSVARSYKAGRRRGSTGSYHRRPSHDAPVSMRRSVSGPRARWVDRGIPEAYEIKVYEIDDVEKMQKRGESGKQGLACFSAKLKFLEHRQQRISEVRAKYSVLKKELQQAKHQLMLEPSKWNKEFDLWQTFEVDSLEHLEALERVTSRLESRVNLCKANIMMVTSFDVSTRRRLKRRRRTAPESEFI